MKAVTADLVTTMSGGGINAAILNWLCLTIRIPISSGTMDGLNVMAPMYNIQSLHLNTIEHLHLGTKACHM